MLTKLFKNIYKLIRSTNPKIEEGRDFDILKIKSHDQIPSINFLKNISRGKDLHLVFENETIDLREQYGDLLKKDLIPFLVGVHSVEPIIKIRKLITDAEIEINQSFFEKAARDYEILARLLINKLAQKPEVKINEEKPLWTFNPLKSDREKSRGNIDDWSYYLYGFHCSFIPMFIIDSPKTICYVTVEHAVNKDVWAN